MVFNSSSRVRFGSRMLLPSPTTAKCLRHLIPTSSHKFSGVSVSTYHHAKTLDLRSRARKQSTATLDQLVCSCPLQFQLTLSALNEGGKVKEIGAAGAGSSTLAPEHKGTPLQSIGSEGRVLKEGRKVAVLGYGAAVLQNCLTAAAILTVHGLSITVADAALADGDLIRSLAQHHQVLVTVEEASSSRYGSHVSLFLSSNGLLHQDRLKWRGVTLKEQMAAAGLNSKHIASTVLSLVSGHQDVFLIM